MSQYYKIVNLDKKEFFSPDVFNDGLKLGAMMNGIHSYVVGRLLLANFDMNTTTLKFQSGYWAGDRIVIVGDESGTNFFGLQTEFNLENYNLLNDLVISEFENIGAKLLFSFIDDNNFQKLILEQLTNDDWYYAQIGFLVHQYPDNANELKKFLVQNFGNHWEKKAKEIWEDKKTAIIQLNA